MTRRHLLLLVSTVAACGGAHSLAQSATAPEPATSSRPDASARSADAGAEAAADGAALSADSRFDIADRGSAPRRDLGRAFLAGAEQRLELSTVTRVMKKGAELAASVVEAPVDVHIEQVGADGTARFDARLGPFRYHTRGDPKLVQMMTQGGAKAGVLGDTIDGHATITGHGLIDQVEFEGSQKHPGPIALALAASLMSSAEALPSGKLGAGARWRVHSTAEVRGNEVELVARYRLVSLESGDIRLRVEHEQPEFAPGPDPGNAKIVKKDSEGEWDYRQGRVFPEGSEIMKRPLPIPGTHDLELWSEVHLALR
jgi:hypothetical protein